MLQSAASCCCEFTDPRPGSAFSEEDATLVYAQGTEALAEILLENLTGLCIRHLDYITGVSPNFEPEGSSDLCAQFLITRLLTSG